MIKSYSDLLKLKTFEERYNYLRTTNQVGFDTFGFDRVFNQMFYTSKEWRDIRDKVIIRDNGCDLGIPGREIIGQPITIHHMNPITVIDINERTELLLNPEYLICTTHETHNAIHYGSEGSLRKDPIERTLNDTCPWRKNDGR